MDKFTSYLLLFLFTMGVLFQGFLYDSFSLLFVILSFVALLIAFAYKREITINGFHFMIVAFVLTYWISIFYAADKEKAILEAMKVTPVIPLLLVADRISIQNMPHIIRSIGWVCATVVGIGILFGMERMNRLESTLEYANVLAILLVVAGIGSIMLYMSERKSTDLILLGVHLTGLILTQSRSVWILWIVALIWLFVGFTRTSSKRIWAQIGGVHVISLLAVMAIRGDVDFLLNRVKSIEPQSSEFVIRLVYWKDSLRMIADHWLSGTGGGGWALLLPYYRSEPYYVKYVHNHYIQIALDVGVIGLLLFVAIIALFYLKSFPFIKRVPEESESVFWKKGIILIVTMLLLHAGFDFDLSFPLMFVLLMLLVSLIFREEKRLVTVRLTRSVQVLGSVGSAAVLLVSAWLFLGYAYKQWGIEAANRAEYAYAQTQFEKSASMLPWASTVHYESAKAFILQGNATREKRFYESAIQSINKALNISPLQTLYKEFEDKFTNP